MSTSAFTFYLRLRSSCLAIIFAVVGFSKIGPYDLGADLGELEGLVEVDELGDFLGVVERRV